MTSRFRLLFACVLLGLTALFSADRLRAEEPLRIIVMDPLSDEIACDCVAGYARRDYNALGDYLEIPLGRPVEVAFSESLMLPSAGDLKTADLVIGKYSIVEADAKRTGLTLRPLAMLTNLQGETTLQGWFVVRADDPAQSMMDLIDAGRSIAIGPQEAVEKHAAALATLEAFGVAMPDEPIVSPSCTNAALAVDEGDVDVAAISDYAAPLLSGCGTVDEGRLRVIGRTDPVPFIGVFASPHVSPNEQKTLLDALASVDADKALLEKLESRDGFTPIPIDTSLPQWIDWRNTGRQAIREDVPRSLEHAPELLWSHTMTGAGMAGIAVEGRYLIVADKAYGEEEDIFRCLDTATGAERWKIQYPAKGAMDFTNSPRANPVIHEGLAYLFGAFGDLHCVELATGKVVWKRNVLADFNADLPMWGTCGAPIIVDDKLILQPGGEQASIVALDPKNGDVIWQTPGDPPGYSCLVLATLGGKRQVVGYDIASMGGWDPETGKRLWKLIPELDGDFNVATPIIVDGKLLVSTENNGTRLYAFNDDGTIVPEPEACNEWPAPDTSTPVLVGRTMLGSAGGLTAVDLDDDLAITWEEMDDPFFDYCSFIAAEDRVLVVSQLGVVALLKLNAETGEFEVAGQHQLFADVAVTEREVWSHPALIGNRLYVRNLLATYCFVIGE